MTTTGTFCSAGTLRKCSRTLSPLPPGIITSSSTRSGWTSFASSLASPTSAASANEYPSPRETRISSRSVGSSSQMRIVGCAINSHRQTEDQDLVPGRAPERDARERAAGVLVEPRPADHRQLVEEPRREHPGDHQLALRQEVGAAAVRGAGPRARAHDVRVADRVGRDAAVVEKLAVEVLVAGSLAARAAVDVDVVDLAIRDPNRPGAGERDGAACRSGDRESPARSRNRDHYSIDHLQPPELDSILRARGEGGRLSQ